MHEPKPLFEERMKLLLKDCKDYQDYLNSLKTPQRKSIRVNTIKSSIDEVKNILRHFEISQVPWCKEGFFINSKVIGLGNLPEHWQGKFFIQSAVSMIPALVLNPKQTDLVADLCAAPGAKTTHLASLVENKGLILANEIDKDRVKTLISNLQRCGVLNTVITLMDGLRFRGFEFDRILLDAPCSGTGTIRKSLKTLKIYNTKMITKLANMQKRLIENAFNNLKENGVLVYSTCSLEPEENESVVNHLLNKYNNAKIEKIDIKIKRSPAVLEFENEIYNDNIKNCLRIWPQDNDTEGFFVAKIKKS